ncbi:MAG: hypothetical protein L0196_03300 [candidate division Zixibacteria bacterium]|nr:hypothetical protein [candidate division Zixibacteria bacterium]
MKQEQLVEKLSKLEENQPAEIDSLAQQVVSEAREPVRAAVQHWQGYDPKMSAKAALLLSGLEELVVVPLLEAPNPSDLRQLNWSLHTVVEAELELRKQTLEKFEKLLEDTRQIPIPPSLSPIKEEEEPPPRRVCDEAYLLLRLLLNYPESEEAYYMNARAFLDLEDREKNAEIAKWKKSRTWTLFAENE